LLILVTRPAAQAVEWVARLQARGLQAEALPLIGIDAVDDPAPLVAAWRGLATRRLAVFVSPNSVRHFFAARPRDAAWPTTTLAASPGPGTTQALRDAGVPADCLIEPAADAAQFDSESLWVELAPHDWAGREVLLVRGDGGRDWLADQLRGCGARVEQLAAYRRCAPRFDAAQRLLLERALCEPASVLWFFSSSEAIDHLEEAIARMLPMPATRWPEASALATHPRIAERARSLGIVRVLQARPAFDAVVACIQSMRP
jgi:uroporphyrinogen-III synthase